VAAGGFGVPPESAAAAADGTPPLAHGAVVIASITSCTNTSHPDLMLGAALLARKARARGLQVAPGVKTSFAPGSRVVTRYLERAGLLADLAALGFDVAAYGCATCIGNSGPLPPAVESAVREQNLVVAAVLSGNRNFEGRIHALTRANYLCSPLLVVAYALAGNVRRDLTREPLGHDAQGQPVLLADIWPTPAELAAARQAALRAADYPEAYDPAAQANPIWDALPNPDGALFPWEPDSTYIREPPFFSDLPAEPAPGTDFDGLRVLGFFGDFVTTDHISPAGQIAAGSPAAASLQAQGPAPPPFNSYGSRRGNHEVMLRGTFANIRLRNRLADREGGWTRLAPGGEELPIYEAAQRQAATHTPLLILAGKMYGAGSSRDWAAKGTALLGVKVVLAESFERIHRSNLVEMGVLPLAFAEGQTADTLGLTGFETYRVTGLSEPYVPRRAAQVSARNADGREICFEALIRIDTPLEWNIYRHGGLLPYVLRKFEE
ncbi:MAG: aconitate hydratase, partial [Candidatus Marinimicrobia bacterium]|nr:aconitate hydratase [Candidatus Neomarinimicrobiota bacterium]